jgi:hypothetical protein
MSSQESWHAAIVLPQEKWICGQWWFGLYARRSSGGIYCSRPKDRRSGFDDGVVEPVAELGQVDVAVVVRVQGRQVARFSQVVVERLSEHSPIVQVAGVVSRRTPDLEVQVQPVGDGPDFAN